MMFAVFGKFSFEYEAVWLIISFLVQWQSVFRLYSLAC